VRAANDPGHVPDLDVPWEPVEGEGPLPTDPAPLASTPARPNRGKLHGADNPWGWADNRGATLRTVRLGP
jgi:hypothetical protein